MNSLPIDDFPEVQPFDRSAENQDARSRTRSAITVHWHGEPDDAPLKEWLVYEIFPRVGKALVAGQWGTYKTFAALDLAASVMTKTPFAGRAVDRQGGVLFIAAEGQDEVRIRLRGVVEGKIIPALEGEGSDQALPIDPEHLPFAWVTECPRLNTDEALPQLRSLVAAVSAEMESRGIPLALVIIDTMMASAGFKDANDSAEAQRVLDVLTAIAKEFEVLVVAIDHFGKDVSTGTRNSSVKEDNVDAVLALLGEKDLSGKIKNTRAAIRKVRGAPTGREIPFTTRLVPLGDDQDGRPLNTLVIEWHTAAEDLPQPAKPPADPWRKHRYLRDALDVVADSAQPIRPFGNEGPLVKAVDRNVVRSEFYKAYPADGETESARHAAKRQAFNRSVKAMTDTKALNGREIDDRYWFWR